MYVTQTYLGSAGAEAKLFVYYLFEGYDPRQARFTSAVERELARLGDRYGSDVTLFMPQAASADRIEGEVRTFESLWMAVRNSLPGLLLTPRPLRDFTDEQDDNIFLPFEGDDPSEAAATIQSLREATDFKLYWREPQQNLAEPRKFGARLWQALELKPGIWGFRVDLKKLGFG